MRWRSINTPPSSPRVGHSFSADFICTGRSLQRVRCHSNDQLYFENLLTPDARKHPMSSSWTRPVRKLVLHPLWVREQTHIVASGARVQCLTLDTWHTGSTPIYTGHANSHTAASGASVRCLYSIKTSSNRKLSKTKFDPLDLRTFLSCLVLDLLSVHQT